jgi:hypothetical protein
MAPQTVTYDVRVKFKGLWRVALAGAVFGAMAGCVGAAAFWLTMGVIV